VSALDSFQKHIAVGANGYAATENVDKVNSSLIDETQSFWFAEVLKYLYLTFDDPVHISLDEYVFNTECHPLKAAPAKSSYGSGLTHHKEQFTAQHGPLST